jgi:hypothetical protein
MVLNTISLYSPFKLSACSSSALFRRFFSKRTNFFNNLCFRPYKKHGLQRLHAQQSCLSLAKRTCKQFASRNSSKCGDRKMLISHTVPPSQILFEFEKERALILTVYTSAQNNVMKAMSTIPIV